MIDKKELRIGNLVFVDSHRKNFFTIVQLKTNVAVVKGETTFQAEYELLAPVQLTKEILLNNLSIHNMEMGKKISQDITLYLSMQDDGLCQLLLEQDSPKQIENGTASNKPCRIDSTCAACNNSSVRLSPIRYLHQLQNIYHDLKGMEIV